MNIKTKSALLILVVIVAFGARIILYKGATPVSLAPAPALSGAISQSLASSTTKKIEQPDKDYRLGSIDYFASRSWAVTFITPVDQPQNKAFLVLHQVDGVYRVVLGPGTAFSAYATYSLPLDVFKDLVRQGVIIYQSIGGQ